MPIGSFPLAASRLPSIGTLASSFTATDADGRRMLFSVAADAPLAKPSEPGTVEGGLGIIRIKSDNHSQSVQIKW